MYIRRYKQCDTFKAQDKKPKNSRVNYLFRGLL